MNAALLPFLLPDGEDIPDRPLENPGAAEKKLLFLPVWRKNTPVGITILAWFIEFASQTAILLALVWVLIKFQKLDQDDGFHFLKVLGVVALSGGPNLVPYFGHYISVTALLVGLKLVTRSPYTDVLFTTAISYALMFCANLFIIGALMGDLRPSARDAGTAGQAEVTPPQAQTIEPEPEPVAPTNPPAPPPAPPAASQVSVKPASAVAGHLVVKGLIRNGAKSVVTLDAGGKVYTLFLGDSLDLQTAGGTSRVRFDNLDADGVTLNIDGKPVKLPAH